jgi:hypothetical protein
VKRGLYLVRVAMTVAPKSALHLETFCRCFSFARDFFVFDNLPLSETAKASFLDRRDMNKHILAAP